MSSLVDAPPDPWATVVGNVDAVAALQAAAAGPVHAYLLVGPRGAGARTLARAFAAVLLANDKPDPGRDIALALAESHPDLTVVERVGASISAPQADQIVERASRAPVEGSRKVLVLDEFHLVAPAAASKLLKTIEEPPDGTVFVVLADEVSPDLVTIASRCVRVDLAPLTVTEVMDALEAEGIARDQALVAAEASQGDLDRARVLATDERVAIRHAAWGAVHGRLDGSGASATAAVDDLLSMIDDSLGPLRARHALEVEDLEARVAATGERGSGRKDLVERHKREERRYRTDELRFGLLTLARHYRDQLVVSPRPAPVIAGLDAIQAAAEGFIRNPNERLQMQALFVTLGDLGL